MWLARPSGHRLLAVQEGACAHPHDRVRQQTKYELEDSFPLVVDYSGDEQFSEQDFTLLRAAAAKDPVAFWL